MDAMFAETLIAKMPDAVVYSDREGTIRFWNGGAVRMFAHTADEAVGQSLDLIIPEGLRPRHWNGYRETMRTGRTRYGDGQTLSVPAIRKDGKRISVAFTIVPFVDNEGALTGIDK
jgi:PAS domain S-box-containing protein